MADEVAVGGGGLGESAQVHRDELESHIAESMKDPEYALASLRADMTATLDAYAPIARCQRGCPDDCGCTDCEMVEDLRALLADPNTPTQPTNPAPTAANPSKEPTHECD